MDSPDCRYYDLKVTPGRIRDSLEDFVPWCHYGAVERFYALVERLNAPGSELESNDCAFTGPAENEHAAVDKALQCSGRVMVLFRNLQRNTAAGQIELLATQLHHELAGIDPKFRWGMIGTTIVPVRYLALPEARGQQRGVQLMISFWAWGDSERQNMLNLERVVGNLAQALARVCQ